MKTNNFKKKFPFFKFNKKIIYFDSAATSLKINTVVEETSNFYKKINVTDQSLTYESSNQIKNQIDLTRKLTANLLNCQKNEIAFTSSTTHALNQVYSFFKDNLNENDEIILNYLEHASNIIP
jgi:cysteine desulfurase / selenocysteine lyase